MKKLLCLLLAIAALPCSARAETWRSLSQLHAETPDRWVQTYETEWRTVSIDAAVALPQAEAFPILKVRKMPAVADALLPVDADVRRNMPGILQFYTGSAEYALKGSTMFKSIDHYPGPTLPNVLAEECSFTPQDALLLAQEQLLWLYGLDGSHFRLDETLVYSRIWRYKDPKSSPVFTTAVTAEGSYTLRFEQLLQGVPYFACNETGDGYNGGRWLSEAKASAAHRGKDGYMLLAQLWQVEETVHADVPLLPFAEAKARLEQEILAGRLRTVDTLALGYAPYTDPEDPEVFWLLPVWYAKGGYSDDPRQEFTPWLDESGAVADDGIARREVVLQAQLGTLLTPSASGKASRPVPEIITWDYVK